VEKRSDVHGQDARAPLAVWAPAYFDPYVAIDIHERRLPHWNQDQAWVFVTWRLADSVPAIKLRAWKAEKDQWLSQHPPPPWDETLTEEFHARFTLRMEEWLDAGEGSCVLRNPRCREIVVAALWFFHGQRYQIGSFVIMPNHVHVCFRPYAGELLEKLLHSWKSYTAKKINAELGRQGELWQAEYFDRIVRNPKHLAACFRYIANNPGKAHLPEGHFTCFIDERSAGVPPAEAQRSAGVPPAEAQRSAGVPPVEAQRSAGVPPAEAQRSAGVPPAEAQRSAGVPPAEAHGQDARAPLNNTRKTP
jgi:type I restriction enzyme R subunit